VQQRLVVPTRSVVHGAEPLSVNAHGRKVHRQDAVSEWFAAALLPDDCRERFFAPIESWLYRDQQEKNFTRNSSARVWNPRIYKGKTLLDHPRLTQGSTTLSGGTNSRVGGLH